MHITLRALSAVAFVAALAGCGASPYDGVWSGTYNGTFTYSNGSQYIYTDAPVSFSVTNRAISASTPVDGTGTIDSTGTGAWQAAADPAGQTPYAFTGTFSGSTVSGTWSYSIPSGSQAGSGSGTWTATKTY